MGAVVSKTSLRLGAPLRRKRGGKCLARDAVQKILRQLESRASIRLHDGGAEIDTTPGGAGAPASSSDLLPWVLAPHAKPRAAVVPEAVPNAGEPAEEPAVILRIFTHLGLLARAPPRSQATPLAPFQAT